MWSILSKGWYLLFFFKHNLVYKGWTSQKMKARWPHWIQEDINARIILKVLTTLVTKAVN